MHIRPHPFRTLQALIPLRESRHGFKNVLHTQLVACSNIRVRSYSRNAFKLTGTTEHTRHTNNGQQKRSAISGRVIVALLFPLGIGFLYSQFAPLPEKKIFDPPRFTPFTIIGRKEVSPTSIVLTLRPQANTPPDSDPYKSSWEKGTWSVEVKQPQLQIARHYTPLPPREGDNKCDLRFLIRKEHKGEVSSYLHRLVAGGTVELRGPRSELDLDSDLSEVVFLAGGTGIAPALQLVHTLLQRRAAEKARPQIHILWANRRREDCIGGGNAIGRDQGATKLGYVVRELQNLQQSYPEHISVEYLVDEEGSSISQKKLSHLTVASSKLTPPPSSPTKGSKLLVVSGPEGFINHFAGAKTWEGGKEVQGVVCGLLGRINLKDWKVWKL